jgi:hypothetical protein
MISTSALRSRRCIATAAAATCLIASTLRGQAGEVGTGGISGAVRDSTGAAIVGAEIKLQGGNLRAETDERGQFLLAKVPAGQLQLQVRRIGFKPDTVDLMVMAGQTVPLTVTVQRLAVELRPVVVYGRQGLKGHMAGFYARKERGMGRFITREEIESRNPANLTDMFRMVAGAQVSQRGAGRSVIRFRGLSCPPLAWLDGQPLFAGEFDLDALSPRSLEGIEIYSGPSSVPTEFLGTRSISSSCGTIVLWSREGVQRAKRRKGISAAAEIAQLVDRKNIFTADQVDVPAHQDSSKKLVPIYPDSMYEHGISGTVIAEFVVDITGEVDVDSYNVVATTHPLFAESVRRVLKEAQFAPAIKQGHPVMQVVHQPFYFVPDTLLARRKR